MFPIPSNTVHCSNFRNAVNPAPNRSTHKQLSNEKSPRIKTAKLRPHRSYLKKSWMRLSSPLPSNHPKITSSTDPFMLLRNKNHENRFRNFPLCSGKIAFAKLIKCRWFFVATRASLVCFLCVLSFHFPSYAWLKFATFGRTWSHPPECLFVGSFSQ